MEMLAPQSYICEDLQRAQRRRQERRGQEWTRRATALLVSNEAPTITHCNHRSSPPSTHSLTGEPHARGEQALPKAQDEGTFQQRWGNAREHDIRSA
ncbi:hypothetical protein N9L19_00270 [bacterium]|nr:hypothetical protein [bacterium]